MIPPTVNDLKNAICVVAHPDDEVLWFASILEEISHVITVYRDVPEDLDLGRKRADVITRLPYDVVSLAITEAGTYDPAHWQKPEISRFGLSLAPHAASAQTIANYEGNYSLIRAQLEKQLPIKTTVFTHNPWGEYGHADHVQVYRVLSDIRDKLQLSINVSPYISSRSRALAERYIESRANDTDQRPIDSGFADRVANIYKRCKCWTWADDWSWNETEQFLPEPVFIGTQRSADNLGNSTRTCRIPASIGERTSLRLQLNTRV